MLTSRYQRLQHLARRGDPDVLIELLREAERRDDDEGRGIAARAAYRWRHLQLPVHAEWRPLALTSHPRLGVLVSGGPARASKRADVTTPLLARRTGGDFEAVALRARRAGVALHSEPDGGVTLLNAHGTLYATREGERWRASKTPLYDTRAWSRGPRPSAVLRRGRHVVVGSDTREMAVSHDGGETFPTHHALHTDSLLVWGERLINAGADGVHASDDGGETWAPLTTPEVGYAPTFRVFSVRGDLIVTPRTRGALFRRLEDGGWEPIFSDPRPVNALCETPDGLLVAGGRDGLLVISLDGLCWTPLPAPPHTIHALLATPDDLLLATREGLTCGLRGARERGFPGHIEIEPARPGPEIGGATSPVPRGVAPVSALTLSPDGARLIAADLSGRLCTIDVQSGASVSERDLPDLPGPVRALEPLPQSDALRLLTPDAVFELEHASAPRAIVHHPGLLDLWRVDDEHILTLDDAGALIVFGLGAEGWDERARWSTRGLQSVDVSDDGDAVCVSRGLEVYWLTLPALVEHARTRRRAAGVYFSARPDRAWLLDAEARTLHLTRSPSLRGGGEREALPVGSEPRGRRRGDTLLLTDRSASLVRADLDAGSSSVALTRLGEASSGVMTVRSGAVAWVGPRGAIALDTGGERRQLSPPRRASTTTGVAMHVIEALVRAWCLGPPGSDALYVLTSRSIYRVGLSDGATQRIAHDVESEAPAHIASHHGRILLARSTGLDAARTGHAQWSAFDLEGALLWRTTLPFTGLVATSEHLLGWAPKELAWLDPDTGERVGAQARTPPMAWRHAVACGSDALAVETQWRGEGRLIRVSPGGDARVVCELDGCREVSSSPCGAAIVTRGARGLEVRDATRPGAPRIGAVWNGPDEARVRVATRAVSISRGLIATAGDTAIDLWSLAGGRVKRLRLSPSMKRPGALLMAPRGELLLSVHPTMGVTAFDLSDLSG